MFVLVAIYLARRHVRDVLGELLAQQTLAHVEKGLAGELLAHPILASVAN